MKKKLLILLFIHATIFSRQDSDNSENNVNDTTEMLSEENRATQPNKNKIPVINFTTPLVFNPNHTPHPTQPALISNIDDLIVYITGATESGPFGSAQSTINQINAVNNTNIGANTSSNTTSTSSSNATQNTVQPNQIIAAQKINTNNSPSLTPEQLVAAQNHSVLAAGIAASSQNSNHFGIIQIQNAINIAAAHASAVNNASQAANQIKPNQTSAASSVTSQVASQASQDTIANPNPFITINNPVPDPKIVNWNAPLIIDHKNVFFNTQSTIKFEENIVYNPGQNYAYPDEYSDYPAAIIIAKDNITIDLNGFNLSFTPRSSAPLLLNKPTYGIAIVKGVKNIKIISSSAFDKPGSISGFSGFAIYGSGNEISQNYSMFSGMIHNIVIENILMYSNLGGIYLENAVQILCNLISVSYSFGARDIEGIYLKNVFNGIITNCKINQNYSYRSITGIRLIDTISIVVIDSAIDNNSSLENGNAIGILIDATSNSTSHNNRISNCNLIANLCSFTTDKEAVGILLRNESYGNEIANCTISWHDHGPSFGGAPAPSVDPISYGIKINNSSNNDILKNHVGYNGNFGIYDSTTNPTSYSPITPSTPTSISTSLFTNNNCLFQSTNYWITVPNLFPAPESPGIALPTTILYPGDLTAYSGGGAILQNLDIREYN